jgi:hypothetical protein
MYTVHVTIRDRGSGPVLLERALFRQCESVSSRFQMEELPYLTGRGRIMIGEGCDCQASLPWRLTIAIVSRSW